MSSFQQKQQQQQKKNLRKFISELFHLFPGKHVRQEGKAARTIEKRHVQPIKKQKANSKWRGAAVKASEDYQKGQEGTRKPQCRDREELEEERSLVVEDGTGCQQRCTSKVRDPCLQVELL